MTDPHQGVTPQEAMQQLDALSREMGTLSSKLAYVNRELEPVENEYQKFVDDHDLGLYERSVSEDGFRLPSAAMRLKLAHRAMPAELYGRYVALVNSRDRIMKRISSLRVEVDAQRAILSALKVEMEARR